MDQVTTISFHRFAGIRKKFWALQMMGKGPLQLDNLKQLQFYRLLGSGRGLGFNPWPDWSTYALLMVWENKEIARKIIAEHALFRDYRKNSAESWTLFLKNIRSHGTWSGGSPFSNTGNSELHNGPLAVLTRATIKKRSLHRFWSFVPVSKRPLSRADGLIYTKGVGEFPFLQMATISIWKDLGSMKKFAYSSEEHKKAIQKTRDLNWYNEELFARFEIIDSEGTWSGCEKSLLENMPEKGFHKGG